jgi:alkylhydroperoxidase family enzyme
MLRPSAALVAGLVSLALLTACSDQQKDDASDRAGSSAAVAPSLGASEEGLEKQDEVPDEWPPEIPLPLGYKIEAASEPTQADYHSATVLGLPKEAVTATLEEFKSSGFTEKGLSEAMNERGFFNFVNEEWDVSLTAAPMSKKGEPTTEDTGVYMLMYLVSPAK